MTCDPSQITHALQNSRKYKYLCDDTLSRIADWASNTQPNQTQAIKAAKRKLHQVYGAYLSRWNPKRIEKILLSLGDAPTDEALEEGCRQILSLHTSTAERLGMLEEIYRSIFEITGQPQRILDLGCGLSPFALPWMNLPADAQYQGWEIDQRMVDQINRFFQIAAPQSVAYCRDVLAETPDQQVDVALCLKLLPCLQQQVPGISPRLIRDLPASFVVVSFPVRSIGGRGKNMPQNYAGFFEPILDQLGLAATKLEWADELVYVVDKSSKKR